MNAHLSPQQTHPKPPITCSCQQSVTNGRNERQSPAVRSNQRPRGVLQQRDDLPPPLPPLTLHPTNVPIVSVKVLPTPIVGYCRGLTWTIDEQPTEQLRKGQYIELSKEDQSAGIGRLTMISDLRRHWVTFEVTGATQPLNIRVPIPWASLGDLESYTHQNHYFSLAALPPPHHSFANKPSFQDENENPYEFDIEETDIAPLSIRFASITNTPKEEGQ